LLHDITRRVTQLVTDNAPGILTGIGCVGTVGTAVLTGRASVKAHTLCQKADMAYAVEHDGHGKLDSLDKVKITWTLFVPPVLAGSGTIAAIIFANRIHAGQVAAMATLYGLSEGRFQEYREKVTEQLGSTKEQKVKDSVAQDRVKGTPGYAEVILAEGEILCLDEFSARYFRSSMERIKKAENTINSEIYHHDYASLSQFYEEIGLAPTGFSDEVGWNTNCSPIEVRYSTVLSPDDKPCIAIDFATAPRTDYNRLY